MSKTLSLKKLDVTAIEAGKITFETFDTSGTAVVAAPRLGGTISASTLPVFVNGVAADPLAVDERQVKSFTAAELRAMLAELGEPVREGVVLDPTMDLPIEPTDPALLAFKDSLPPVEDRKGSPAPQLPPRAHGSFGLNGIPLIAPQVNLAEHINPATGAPYAQIGPRPVTQISPPPSRRFDGR